MPARVRIIDAWNGWYHINGNTYGTWVRGDPRGWRARHHREHVDGDYKTPPEPDAHARELAQSKKSMDAPVLLSAEARRIACDELVASLIHQKAEVIACAVDDHHYHILARFRLPSDFDRATQKPMGSNPWASSRTRNQPIYAYIRHVVGLAKSRAARDVSSKKLVEAGGVWSKRSKVTPIADRAHQLKVVRYIADHRERGAACWFIPRRARTE